MRKRALTLIALLGCAQVSQAATVTISDHGAGIVSLSLDASGLQFNTVTLDVVPNPGTSLLNVDAAGVDPAGTDKTFANGFMDAPKAFGGFGWSVVGKTVSADGISFAGGPLGAYIEDGTYLLANISYGLSNFTYAWTLQDTGNVVAEGSGVLFPEPDSMVLVGASLIGLLMRRRAGLA